ncbi:polysaccharide biosynthesis tyrosine autokinase [Nocardioides sp.]|uniref:polysaccharide biosynthesis tyrosine autokinase n=1 Tax=Nocardioides sp. TaxID=35761 RepID=UPI003563720D
MELQDYLAIARAHIVGILALVAVGTGLGAAYTLTQEAVYCANSSGFVTTGTSSDGVQASVNDSVAKSRAASYVDIATSRAVADLVIDELGLPDEPAGLVNQITVTQPPDTVLLKIKACAASPLKAQRLADAWARGLSERVAALENPQNLPAQGILGVKPLEAAALPSSPVSPVPSRNILLGALLGLMVGFLYAVVRSRFDRRLQSPEAIEREFHVPMIAMIPEIRRGKGKGEIHGLALSGMEGETKNSWGTGEAYRKLRTNLAYMKVDNPPRVIVVTSPNAHEGKSTTAANLAAAIALSGKAVTLVDADLRRPTLAQSLSLVEGAGLTDVLIGNAELEDVFQEVPDMNGTFQVLAAGGIPPNPSELLSSFAMQGVLADLGQRGYVVIDAPPLLPVTDGAILTRHSDGCIVVVRHGHTLDHELGSALAELEAVQGTVLGVVFNRVPVKNDSYGYYGRYQGPTRPSAGSAADSSDKEPANTGRRRRR